MAPEVAVGRSRNAIGALLTVISRRMRKALDVVQQGYGQPADMWSLGRNALHVAFR
jgi:hypothetical protein